MKRESSQLEPDWGMDIGKTPQFQVIEIEMRDDVLYVRGRAYNSLKLKTRFKVLKRMNADTDVDSLDEAHTLIEVNLRVQSIKAYRKQLNRLNAGMTAELELSGDTDILLDMMADLDSTEKIILTK